MESKKLNLWKLLRNVIVGGVVAAFGSAVLMETAPDVVSPSCGENAMFAFLFIALSAGMYGIFAVLRIADKEEQPAIAAALIDIDYRIRLHANSRRYEFLRDVAFNLNAAIEVRDSYGNLLIKDDLDNELDRVIRELASATDVQS